MAHSSVRIHLPPHAGELAAQAADVLNACLPRIFPVRCETLSHDGTRSYDGTHRDGSAYDIIMVQVGPEHADIAADTGPLPALSDQGHLLRTVAEDTIVLVGGSDQALAWAAYELLGCYGVQFTLQDDHLPTAQPQFYLPRIDRTFEPRMKLRSWRTLNVLPHGSEMWTLEQYVHTLDQLHKLKFNGVYLVVWPQHPFVDIQIDGLRRDSASLLFGLEYPIDQDTIGYQDLWADMPVLTNPAFADAKTYGQMLSIGRRLISGILDHARKLGLHVTTSVQPLEFPKEFSSLLEQSSISEQAGNQTCTECGDLTNPGHMRLVEHVLRSHIDQLPGTDMFEIAMPEHPHAERGFEQCWQELDHLYGLERDYPLSALLDYARHNTMTVGGPGRAVREFKSAICQLHFFDRFFRHNDVVAYARNQGAELAFSLWGGEQILPFIDRVLHDHASLIATVDYTSTRVLGRLDKIEAVNTGRMDAYLILTLQDDNIGWMPQVSHHNADLLLTSIDTHKWNGYLTRQWPVSDLNATAAFLADRSWSQSVTPEASYRSYSKRVHGGQAQEYYLQAMQLLEQATAVLDQSFPSLLFPVPDNAVIEYALGKHPPVTQAWPDEPAVPDLLKYVRVLYRQARRKFEQAQPHAARPQGRRDIAYWIARTTFAIDVLQSIEMLCDGTRLLTGSGNSTQVDDDTRRQACTLYGRGLEAARSALRTMVPFLCDDADRGAQAAYYHVLVRQVERKLKKWWNIDTADIQRLPGDAFHDAGHNRYMHDGHATRGRDRTSPTR